VKQNGKNGKALETIENDKKMQPRSKSIDGSVRDY
jgi:hypothetical protein